MAKSIRRFYPDFNKKRFLDLVFDDLADERELKEKMHHTAMCLYKTLPESYEEALSILMRAAPCVKGFDALSFPDYVELFGMENWDLSLPALVFFTKYSTSELAIRPFLARDPERVMAHMRAWAEDEDPHVRRLASEGCRPKLPWAKALPGFRQDPTPILPILEKLKNDEAEYVRKSVANNLNDISKDHPELVLSICERWFGHTRNTDWIVKHACRGMLKAGNTQALLLFGFEDPAHVSVENLSLDKEVLLIGEEQRFTFEMMINSMEKSKVRLEFGVYYVKAKGASSRKIFKITEDDFDPGSHFFSKRHSFEDRSIRRHYAGMHHISIIVNGVEKAKASFLLGGI